MRAGVAVRRICHDASAALRHRAAGQEIDTRGAEPARGDIGRDHRVAVPAEYGGHSAVAAARLPYRAAKVDVPEQRLGHPRRRRIEILARALEGRHMNWPGWRCARRGARAWRVGVRIKFIERQTELRHAHRSGPALRRIMATLAAKAQLRLRGLLAVRIAQAAWSQRPAASLMPPRAIDRAAAQGGEGQGG